MKSIHLIIPDLFLHEDVAAEVCAGLRLPVLEKMLARGSLAEMSSPADQGRTDLTGLALENRLCKLFDVHVYGDVPVAPISAAFDGLAEGCWLRADPVHLSLQRDQLLLAKVPVGKEEAEALCVSLNGHFAGQGMEFFSPHPQRWYVRLGKLPKMRTTPLSQVIGCDVRRLLPSGEEAAHWLQVFNEIQMLLHAHLLNEVRASRGELPINSVWFWGGGDAVGPLRGDFQSVSSDDVLVEMFAKAAGILFSSWSKDWHVEDCSGEQLLVWLGLSAALRRGDFVAWRNALQDFETSYTQPLWRALRAGKITQLNLDMTGGNKSLHVQLTRSDTWAVWRRAKTLSCYSMV